MRCHHDPALGEMYALVRSQGLLEGRLKALAHQVSDANLQQMPDFQQRVEVLKQLEYIAQDNTVLLKASLPPCAFEAVLCKSVRDLPLSQPPWPQPCHALLCPLPCPAPALLLSKPACCVKHEWTVDWLTVWLPVWLLVFNSICTR